MVDFFNNLPELPEEAQSLLTTLDPSILSSVTTPDPAILGSLTTPGVPEAACVPREGLSAAEFLVAATTCPTKAQDACEGNCAWSATADVVRDVNELTTPSPNLLDGLINGSTPPSIPGMACVPRADMEQAALVEASAICPTKLKEDCQGNCVWSTTGDALSSLTTPSPDLIQGITSGVNGSTPPKLPEAACVPKDGLDQAAFVVASATCTAKDKEACLDNCVWSTPPPDDIPKACLPREGLDHDALVLASTECPTKKRKKCQGNCLWTNDIGHKLLPTTLQPTSSPSLVPTVPTLLSTPLPPLPTPPTLLPTTPSPTSSPPLPPKVELVFSIQNVDFSAMADTHKAEMTSGIKRTVASNAGVPESNVNVVLTAGSVTVSATITVPDGMDAATIINALDGNQAAITTTVVSDVGMIVGLPTTGTVSISGLSTTVEATTPAPMPLPQTPLPPPPPGLVVPTELPTALPLPPPSASPTSLAPVPSSAPSPPPAAQPTTLAPTSSPIPPPPPPPISPPTSSPTGLLPPPPAAQPTPAPMSSATPLPPPLPVALPTPSPTDLLPPPSAQPTLAPMSPPTALPSSQPTHPPPITPSPTRPPPPPIPPPETTPPTAPPDTPPTPPTPLKLPPLSPNLSSSMNNTVEGLKGTGLNGTGFLDLLNSSGVLKNATDVLNISENPQLQYIKASDRNTYIYAYDGPVEGSEVGMQSCHSDSGQDLQTCQWVLVPSLSRPGAYRFKAPDHQTTLYANGGTDVGNGLIMNICPADSDDANCQWVIEPSLTRTGMSYIKASDQSTYIRAVPGTYAGSRLEMDACPKGQNLASCQFQMYAVMELLEQCGNQSKNDEDSIVGLAKTMCESPARFNLCPEQLQDDTGASGAVDYSVMVRHLWLFAALGVLAFWSLVSLIWHKRWLRNQRMREKASRQKKEQKKLSERLVTHFMPSVAVEAYQFQGMKPHKVGISLEFDDLGLALKGGDRCLQGVTGKFDEGKMVAIMGPSGSGKSTFMNVLCGKATYGSMTGVVKINGLYGDVKQIKNVTGFVPQDDVVHERLTVREQLRYSAELRNPRGTSKYVHKAIVEDVLHVLQIDHIQTSIVGGVEERGISGGQRKRVNIGLELAACPILLFLDEPTSGLDSTSSFMIINSLKKMTKLGMTVIMVIHQPRYSLFTLFDQVLLLGRGGRTVYLGPSDSAVSYFEELGFQVPQNDNPADFMMDVLSGEALNQNTGSSFRIDDLVKAWQENCESYKDSAGSFTQSFSEAVRSRPAPAEELEPNVEGLDSVNHHSSHASQGARDNNRISTDSRGSRVSLSNANMDNVVVVHALDEQWNTIDLQDKGELDAFELKRVLESCLGTTIEDAEMGEFMGSFSHKEKVTKNEFVDFLSQKCVELSSLVSTNSDGAHQGDSGVFNVIDKYHDAMEDLAVGGLAAAAAAQTAAISTSAKRIDQFSNLRRKLPGAFHQFRTVLHRKQVQWWRGAVRRAIDLLLTCFIAGALGLMSIDTTGDPPKILLFHLGLALVTHVSALKTFADRPIFWRESGRGITVWAFYCARITVDLFETMYATICYVSVYYVITSPKVPFEHYFIPCVCVAWVASGWGYFVSALLPPSNAVTAGVIFMLILAGILGDPGFVRMALREGGLPDFLVSTSTARWSMQMFFLQYHEKMGGLVRPEPPECAEQVDQDIAQKFVDKLGMHRYNLAIQEVFLEASENLRFGFWYGPIVVLSVYGVMLRILGYLCLKFTNRDKQV